MIEDLIGSFLESSEIGSSSLGHVVIDSSLYQCSFSAMSLFFFYQIVLLLFYQKQMFLSELIMIVKNNKKTLCVVTISIICSNLASL